MKFLINGRIHEDKRHEALEAFSAMTAEDDLADLGNVRLIGRWHDLVSFEGVAVCETDDPGAVSKWILNWNNVIDCDVTPVLDDDEARAIGRAKTSG
jgi:hypothetical protein